MVIWMGLAFEGMERPHKCSVISIYNGFKLIAGTMNIINVNYE